MITSVSQFQPGEGPDGSFAALSSGLRSPSPRRRRRPRAAAVTRWPRWTRPPSTQTLTPATSTRVSPTQFLVPWPRRPPRPRRPLCPTRPPSWTRCTRTTATQPSPSTHAKVQETFIIHNDSFLKGFQFYVIMHILCNFDAIYDSRL